LENWSVVVSLRVDIIGDSAVGGVGKSPVAWWFNEELFGSWELDNAEVWGKSSID